MKRRRDFLKLAACPALRMFGQAGNNWYGERHADVVYKRVGAATLAMDIYLPRARKFAKAPVMYYVHGGGWANFDKNRVLGKNFLPVFEQLSGAGFACVSVDYRLCDKAGTVLMRDCVVDAKDGLRFLRKAGAQYGLDARNIVVWGSSAGGQIVQLLAFAGPDDFEGDPALARYGFQPRAGISWFGPSDFTDPALFKDIRRFTDHISRKGIDYAADPKAFEEMSSYFWIRKNSPPLLLLQGDKDTTIPLAHATHLKEKADRIGADVELVIVKNAGHSWMAGGGVLQPSVAEIQRITADYAIRHVQR